MEREQHPVVRAILAEYRSLLRYAEQLVSDIVHWDAEDVVQDVIARLLSLPVDRIPIERVASYLRTSVRNRSIDLYRSMRDADSLEAKISDDGASLADLIADAGRDVESTVAHREFCEALYEAIGKLPETERNVLIATEFMGKRFADLSAEWGIPIGTLLSRKSRAISRIRRVLASECWRDSDGI
jgi:RNA polymerase sigma factor (sigma-70 family)